MVIVAGTAARFAVSMTLTEAAPVLTTKTSAPSGETARAEGVAPTATVPSLDVPALLQTVTDAALALRTKRLPLLGDTARRVTGSEVSVRRVVPNTFAS